MAFYRVLLVVSLAACMLPQPALGIQPLDDDAATGADAGDDVSFATSLERQGTIHGNLTKGVDEADVYRVNVPRGHIVEIRHETEKGWSDPVRVYSGAGQDSLHAGGIGWQLVMPGHARRSIVPAEEVLHIAARVATPLALDQGPTFGYRIHWSIIETSTYLEFSSSDPRVVAELALQDDADWVIERRAFWFSDGVEPMAGGIVSEFLVEQAEYGRKFHGSGVGTARSAGVGGWTKAAGFEVETPDVSIASQELLGLGLGLGADLRNSSGWFRFGSFGTGSSSFHLTVAGTGNASLATYGDDKRPVTWTTDDLDERTDTTFAVVANRASAGRTMELPGGFYGTIAAADTNVSARGPSGQLHESDGPYATLVLHHTDEGSWGFGIGPTVDVVRPNRVILVGTDVPWVGHVPGLPARGVLAR